jgi:hypothetical protein
MTYRLLTVRQVAVLLGCFIATSANLGWAPKPVTEREKEELEPCPSIEVGRHVFNHALCRSREGLSG